MSEQSLPEHSSADPITPGMEKSQPDVTSQETVAPDGDKGTLPSPQQSTRRKNAPARSVEKRSGRMGNLFSELASEIVSAELGPEEGMPSGYPTGEAGLLEPEFLAPPAPTPTISLPELEILAPPAPAPAEPLPEPEFLAPPAPAPAEPLPELEILAPPAPAPAEPLPELETMPPPAPIPAVPLPELETLAPPAPAPAEPLPELEILAPPLEPVPVTPLTVMETITPPTPSPDTSTLPSVLAAGPGVIVPLTKGEGVQSTEDDRISPAASILTPTGWDSLHQRRAVAKNAQPDQPAVLAYARPLPASPGTPYPGSTTTTGEATSPALLFEAVDDNPRRTWSEDEILLVEHVTDQLTLALENAQLFEESRDRAEQLTILNAMSRDFSAQLDTDQVLQTVYRYTSQLIDTTNFYVALYHPETNEVSFPFSVEEKNKVQWRNRVLGNGLTEYIIQTRRPVLIKENVVDYIKTVLGIEAVGKTAECWLGVPMIYHGQVTGVIAVQSYTQANLYSESDRQLLGAVASQAAVALENARLFEQTQKALTALEIGERYQKSVAQAVTTLTERGMAALSEVLQTLGEAARASRAYYIETQVDPHGTYWRLIAEWCTPEVQSQLSNPALRRMSTKWLAPWLEELQKDGYIASLIRDLTPQQAEFMISLGTRSILQFAVPGRHDIPGCIGFEQADYERQWKPDEIAALQTAASALANTIAREDLFTQVQITLAETEALYQASAHLNSAASYNDILTVLRQHTILGQINATNVSLNLFDRPWSQAKKPEWIIPIAQWVAKTFTQPPVERQLLTEWGPAEVLLHPERPTVVMDVANDTRLDDATRSKYLDRLGAKSLLFVPLNVAGRWIGHIVAAYRLTTGFPEQETRRLISLAGQAAIAVQNLQSLEIAEQRAREAQRRSEEVSLINRVVTGVTGSSDLQGSLEIFASELGKALNVHTSIALLNEERQALTLVAAFSPRSEPEKTVKQSSEAQVENADDGYDLIGHDLPLEGNYAYQQVIVNRRTQVINDAQNNPLTAPIHHNLKARGVQTMIIIPMIAATKVIGTVGVDILQEGRQFNPEEIRLAETIVLQTSTAIQNARLFEQTQQVLAETETLYQASASLQMVSSYSDILEALRRYTILGGSKVSANQEVEEAVSLTLNLFDWPWMGENAPEWVIPIARLGELPSELISERYPLSAFTSARQYLNPDSATIMHDVHTDPRLDDNSRALYADLYQTSSAVFAPLVAGGLWIGFVNAMYADSISFTDQEIRSLMVLVGQAAVAVQNLRLLEESRRRASQLQTAAEIARDTSSTLALDLLLQRLITLLRERFGYYHASIFLLDETGTAAVIRESTGEAGDEMKRLGHSLDVGGRSVIGQTTHSGQPVVLNDVTQEEAKAIHRYNPLLPLTRAELGIPLKIGERVIGALDVQADRINAFSEDDVSVLQILADQIAIAVDNARAYELIQKGAEEIREADRLKSQFLANMSHELRTPLNSIIGFSRVILKGIDGPVSDLQQQDLTAIYNSGQHLLGLINDVLDLSKIEAGKMELAFEDNVNLAEIIKSVMSTTSGLVKDKPITLHQNISPEVPKLRIDSMKIRQVLLNLLSNAAKFTEKGSITVEAFVSKDTATGGDEVIVQVIDTGPGIALADQAKLFQPFSQVDGSLTRKTGGSGLGLSISQHLVQMHNGRIGLESEIGKGSTFFFALPIGGIKSEQPTEGEGFVQPLITPAKAEIRPSPTVERPSVVVSGGENVDSKAKTEQLVPLKGAISSSAGVTKSIERPIPAKSTPVQPQPVLPEQIKVTQPLGTPTKLGPLPPTPAPQEQVPEKKRKTGPTSLGIVLTIEKDPQVIELYRRYMANQNYTVVALTELDQALTAARGIQPFAITLDVSMHVSETAAQRELGTIQPLNGWQMLKALKTDPLTKNIPVIVCTILTDKERGRNLGADEYLMKPILEDDLAQAIRRISEAKSRRAKEAS